MRLALALAQLGQGRTHPNPRVGAVAVRDGRLVGMGAHLRCGGPHAETSLMGASPTDQLRGSTVYINLEPCAHHGKTPPCAPALARAGITRVVAAMEDPDPRVQGRGLQLLREVGISVEVGLQREAARRLNAPFLWWQLRRHPWVTLKIAATLDGRIAANDGTSRWISGTPAREAVHRWRAACDAIVVGRGTWVADRPALTARPTHDPLARLRRRAGGAGDAWPPQPARVVLDSRCRTAEEDDLLAHMSASAGGPWIVACGKDAPASHRKRLEAVGARCWVLPQAGGGAGVDLETLLVRLAEEGRLELLVEGGATLATELLRQGLITRLRLFLAPSLLGGERVWTRDLKVDSLGEQIRWGRLRARRLGRDLLVDGLSPEAERAVVHGDVATEATRCSPG